jgi:hypothetical protein
MSKVHPLETLRAVKALQQIELQKQRFEIGSGEPVLDAPHSARKLQPPGMFEGWQKQASETAAQIGRAAHIGLGVRIGRVEREDSGRFRQLL